MALNKMKMRSRVDKTIFIAGAVVVRLNNEYYS